MREFYDGYTRSGAGCLEARNVRLIGEDSYSSVDHSRITELAAEEIPADYLEMLGAIGFSR